MKEWIGIFLICAFVSGINGIFLFFLGIIENKKKVIAFWIGMTILCTILTILIIKAKII